MQKFIPDRAIDKRLELGMSPEDVAKKAGISNAETIRQAEAGETTPRPGTVRKWAEALDLSTNDFYVQDEVKKPATSNKGGVTKLRKRAPKAGSDFDRISGLVGVFGANNSDLQQGVLSLEAFRLALEHLSQQPDQQPLMMSVIQQFADRITGARKHDVKEDEVDGVEQSTKQTRQAAETR